MSHYVSSRHATILAALVTLLLTSCAGLGGGTTRGSTAVLSREEARRAVEALQRAERLFDQGDYEVAAGSADSLWSASRSEPALETVANRALWLKGRALEADGDLSAAAAAMDDLLDRIDDGPIHDEAVVRRARILRSTGETSSAVRLLLDNPTAIRDPELELIRDAAAELERPALERLASDYRVTVWGATILHAELARVLLLADEMAAARSLAREVLTADPEEDERRLTEVILEAEAGVASRPLIIGAILPLSGRFAGVGALLREGIELALERHDRERPGAPRVEILFEDDGSNPDRAVALVRELEEAGALAIVGPIRSESFAAAARSRRNPRLLLISPTATEILEPSPNSWTLWDRTQRERDVARDLGGWIARELELPRAAVLYSDDQAGRTAFAAFVEGVEASGGELVQATAYDADSTTFSGPISTVAEARPDVVFVPAPTGQTVLQIAPQLYYYGLDRSLIVGGSAWSEPSVLRRLDPLSADYRVVGTFVDRSSEGTAWADFKMLYENKYRKSLSTNMLPALGFDATDLVLSALAEVRLPLPGAVSRAIRALPERPGVTGHLRLDPRSSTVARRTLVRMMLNRKLLEPDPAELLSWLASARTRADSIMQARADSIAEARERDPGVHP